MINVIATIQLKYFLRLKTTEQPAYFNKSFISLFLEKWAAALRK